MDSLPRELFGNIVSRLQLADWIACVNVCRAWRVMVSVEARKSLNQVAIDNDTMTRIQSIRHFPSVRSVALHGNTVAARAPLLPVHQITTLELVNISMVDDRLIATLRPFSNHLKSLTIETHTWPAISVAKVLGLFPNLIHFGFLTTDKATMRRDTFMPDHSLGDGSGGDNNNDNSSNPEEEDMRQLRLDPLPMDHHLVSLQLSQFIIEASLLGILRRLPRLELLRLEADYLFLDPMHLLETCPGLKRLHEGPQQFPFQQTDWAQVTALDHGPPANGLSYLSMRTLTLKLFETIDTHSLEVLHLPNIYHLPSSSSVTSFPHLHTLSCQEAGTDSHLLARLLNHCPRLEYLYLNEHARHRDQPRLSRPLVDAIVQLPRLRGLSIHSSAWYEPLAPELLHRLDRQKITHLSLKLWEVEHLIEPVLRMDALQELRLGTLHRWTTTLDSSGSPKILLGHLKSLKRFHLHLEGVTLTRQELLQMSHLQVIHLVGSHSPPVRDLESLVTLAPRLKTLSIAYDDPIDNALVKEKNRLLMRGTDLGIDISVVSAC